MALTESTMLKLGTTAPDFALTDVVKRKLVSRDDFRDQKALLVFFICTHCPYVKHVNEGLAALGRDYAAQPIGIVAISTPDFFLFDADRRLVYRGQFDSSRPGSGIPVTGEDLRAAIDQVLAGQPVPADQRPSIGCNIKWKA